jgi:ABC-type phosphate/phosphonate transport system ATPase subunit
VGLDSRTVLLTTHNVERGLGLVQRAALLARGQIVFEMDGSNWDPGKLQEAYDRQAVAAGAAR